MSSQGGKKEDTTHILPKTGFKRKLGDPITASLTQSNLDPQMNILDAHNDFLPTFIPVFTNKKHARILLTYGQWSASWTMQFLMQLYEL